MSGGREGLEVMQAWSRRSLEIVEVWMLSKILDDFNVSSNKC
jgi:hypothetical protein